jgi:DNA polymerase-1
MAREAAERIAVNTPIQGTAADVIKVAMLAVDKRLQDERLDARMLLQIHDELVFEVSKESREAFMAMVREEMEGAITLEVPLKVSVRYGTNWDEAH